jgi:hypothetical protein
MHLIFNKPLNRLQSQSNEQTITKDSTTNGPFMDIVGVKVQKSFTKTKIQFIKLNDFLKNLQQSCKSFNTNQHILK